MVKDKTEKVIEVEDFSRRVVEPVKEVQKPFLVKLKCKQCGPQEYHTENPPKFFCPKCRGTEVKEAHIF
jgi:predicted nucleic-acid-binding Zn-ribbon protein